MHARFLRGGAHGAAARWAGTTLLVWLGLGCALAGPAQERSPEQREAAAAAQAARKGELTSHDEETYRRNAQARCEVFRNEQDRRDCLDRLGPLGRVQGSVEGGGLLREEVKTWIGAPR